MLFGLVADLVGVRTALAAAGIAMMATPLLLRGVRAAPETEPAQAQHNPADARP